MKFARLLVIAAATLAGAPVTWIGSAYATQLSFVQAPVIVRNGAGTSSMPLSPRTPFLKRLVASVNSDRSTLLWSVYPASVRGQVILDALPGGDPMVTGGW